MRVRPHECAELLRDMPCGVCDAAISAAESEKYAPTDYDTGSSDREADRYERSVLGL